MSNVETRLAQIPDEYEPVSALAREFLSSGVGEEDGGVVLTGHEPDRGRLAYAVTLFPGLSEHEIQRYEQLHETELPGALKSLFRYINGAILCELSIFGIPPSMIGDPPLISRSTRNPHDIASAVNYWCAEFESAEPKEIYFGSRDISWSGQIGYFLRSDGSVVSYPKHGTQYESQTWPSLKVWLRGEIDQMMLHRADYLEECEVESLKSDRRYFWSRCLPWNWHRWLNR